MRICFKSGFSSAPLAAWVSLAKMLNANFGVILERLVEVKQIVAFLWRCVYQINSLITQNSGSSPLCFTTLGTTPESNRVPSLFYEPHTHIYYFAYR